LSAAVRPASPSSVICSSKHNNAMNNSVIMIPRVDMAGVQSFLRSGPPQLR
jgi:hypothetical protein